MKISTKGRYALILMIDLAKNYENNTYMSLKEISDKENISFKYLEKIVASLTKNNYLDVLRGNNGGYRLNRKPEEYSVGEILRVTEGDLAPITCVGNHDTCLNKDECKVYPFWKGLYSEINNYVDNKTLKDFL